MKDINWRLLVNDIQDNNFYTQTELSVMLKVSQQSISNWQNGTRNPSADAKMRLVEIAKKNGVDISKYMMEPEVQAIAQYIGTEKGKELVRIFEQYTRMSQANKEKFMGYAVKLAPKD